MNAPIRNAAVWFEMPAHDVEKSAAFFEAVLETKLKRETMGGMEMIIFPYDMTGVGGNLVQADEPQTAGAPLVHLSCEAPLAEALDRVEKAGGEVVSDIIDLPGGPDSPGRYAYCRAPDGVRFGLFATD
ncbi:MAG: VOC family protein [Rhodobiaceae bacterium]|nr:VOC family protein [Rhodobiaceae bacterium]